MQTRGRNISVKVMDGNEGRLGYHSESFSNMAAELSNSSSSSSWVSINWIFKLAMTLRNRLASLAVLHRNSAYSTSSASPMAVQSFSSRAPW